MQKARKYIVLFVGFCIFVGCGESSSVNEVLRGKNVQIEKCWNLGFRDVDAVDRGDIPTGGPFAEGVANGGKNSPANSLPLLRGKSKFDNFVISSVDEWQLIWRSVKKQVPNVNFTTHMIVGVYRELHGDGILDAFIERIERRTGGIVVYVRTQITPPIFGCVTIGIGQMATYVLVKRHQLPVLFVEDPYWILKKSGDQLYLNMMGASEGVEAGVKKK